MSVRNSSWIEGKSWWALPPYAVFSEVFICGEGFGVASVCASALAGPEAFVALEIEPELL